MKEGYRFTGARIVRATVGRLVMALFRTRFIGVENVPPGGAILAGNHVSYMDPILMWCGAPRPAHFMTKSELFKGFVGWALHRFWAFPVQRGQADRQAITTATDVLKSGGLVGIFPEGTRRAGEGDLGEAQGGVAFIATRADVPVVPVAFVGTEDVMPRGARFPRFARVTIGYGRPLYPSDFSEGSRKERVEAMTSELMRRIAEELQVVREVHHARRGR